jgi:hypothetical protein
MSWRDLPSLCMIVLRHLCLDSDRRQTAATLYMPSSQVRCANNTFVSTLALTLPYFHSALIPDVLKHCEHVELHTGYNPTVVLSHFDLPYLRNSQCLCGYLRLLDFWGSQNASPNRSCSKAQTASWWCRWLKTTRDRLGRSNEGLSHLLGPRRAYSYPN